MTARQVYDVLRAAGFPPAVATTLTAVARRESNFEPDVVNNNPITGDNSWGLLQINMRDAGIRALVASMGLVAEDLKDPATNAKVAFRMWARNNRNLDIAWYIEHPGYKEKYLQHLPEAQAAALEASA